MISMIILRCQVNYAVHDFVAAILGRVENPLDHGDSFVLVFISLVGLEAEQELVEAVVMSLDAVNRALHGIDFAKAEDASITRRAHRFLIGDGIDCSCAVFELSREELVECPELIYVLDQHILEVHAIELAKSKIDVLSKIRWERHAA